MPSTTSSAALVTYSCARWIGLRVWKPTTRFQPRSAKAARVCCGIERELGEGRLQALEDGHLAGQVLPGLAVQARDAGVCLLRRAEAQLGLVPGVVGEHLAHVERGEQRAVLRGQRDALAAGRLGDGERHGERPDGAVRELHALDDALVVGAPHEAAQGGEGAARQHVEIGDLALAQRDALQLLDALRALAGARDERASVRRNQPSRHAATADFTRPRCSR